MATAAKLQKGALLGKGLTSEVFAWGDQRVLKLFLPWRTLAAIQREFEITKAVCAAGVSTPTAFEIVELDGRHGIVFEQIRGHTLVDEVAKSPWRLFAAARQLAELHADMHSRPLPHGLPSQMDQLKNYIEAAESVSMEQKQHALAILDELPRGDCLCHGDFHPANILLNTRGPVIIDWSRATCGHALADVARTSVLFESANLPDDSPWHLRLLMKAARGFLHAAYLKRYFELRGGTIAEIERWRVVQRMVAAAWETERRGNQIDNHE